MDATNKDIEKYRQALRFFGGFLLNQSNNDLYILDLINDLNLPSFEKALRDMIADSDGAGVIFR